MSNNPFLKHPYQFGLGYFGHMIFAFGVLFKMIYATIACLLHAFFPFLFTNTTSGIVKQLYSKIEHRKI